ncbi:hypothetical protein D3C73_818710 [compost metagenome]
MREGQEFMIRRTIELNKQIISTIWETSPFIVLFVFLQGLINSLLPLIEIQIFTQFVNSLSTQIGQHTEISNSLLLNDSTMFWLILFSITIMIRSLFSASNNLMQESLKVKANKTINKRALSIATKVELEKMDDSKFHDETKHALQTGAEGVVDYFF